MESKSIKLRSEVIHIKDLFEEIKGLAKEILYKSRKQTHINLLFNIDDDELLLKEMITDKYKSYEALTNLINNAVKYTTEGSITIKLFQPDLKTIAISITDTGIGIPFEKQNEVFEFFRQADDSNTRIYGGIGVGLTIADRIASLMGGKITLSSELGKGSNFTLFLPIDITKQDKSAN